MLNAYEPNWFLSTVVQSSAALIAIIGGFMISRLVYLASQRNDYDAKRASLESKRQITNSEAEEVTNEINTKVEEWFLRDHLAEILEADGSPDLEPILKNSDYLGGDPMIIEELARKVATMSSTAIKTLNEQFPGDSKIPVNDEELRALGITLENYLEAKVYVQMASILNSRRLTPTGRAFLSSSVETKPLIGTPTPGHTQEDRVRRRTEIEYRGQAIYDEFQSLGSGDNFSSGISSLLKGFSTLVYFGIVGLVFPLYLMTRNPVVLHSNMRTIVFLCFVSGFGALLFFMINTIRKAR